MRVLHLPTSTGNNSYGLAQGEKQLGLDSKVLVSEKNWLNYPCDINLNIPSDSNKLIKLKKSLEGFLQVKNKYEIFHFNYGKTLMHYPAWGLSQLELPFYSKQSKLFVTYNGCDARQKFPTMERTKIAACHNSNCYQGQCNSGKLDQYRRDGIKKMSDYAYHMWAVNPDLLYFLPKDKSSFLPYTPFNYFDTQEVPPAHFEHKLKIVHAPTNREAKGSQYILSALDSLKVKYPGQFEVTLIEKMSNQEAQKSYAQADLIIDQILIGWYGGLAVEVMRMGKPVIARIAKEDLHFLPDGMANETMQAFIDADPATIETQIERCLQDRKYLKEKALAGQSYVRKWHDPKFVAGLTKQKYEEAHD